jgi:hypothetical protein
MTVRPLDAELADADETKPPINTVAVTVAAATLTVARLDALRRWFIAPPRESSQLIDT